MFNSIIMLFKWQTIILYLVLQLHEPKNQDHCPTTTLLFDTFYNQNKSLLHKAFKTQTMKQALFITGLCPFFSFFWNFETNEYIRNLINCLKFYGFFATFILCIVTVASICTFGMFIDKDIVIYVFLFCFLKNMIISKHSVAWNILIWWPMQLKFDESITDTIKSS